MHEFDPHIHRFDENSGNRIKSKAIPQFICGKDMVVGFAFVNDPLTTTLPHLVWHPANGQLKSLQVAAVQDVAYELHMYPRSPPPRPMGCLAK